MERAPLTDDWHQDGALDPSLRFAAQLGSPSEPRAVLLTGATGMLGAFVLAELLRTSAVEVHCLVRDDGGPPAARLRAQTWLSRLGPPPAAAPSTTLSGPRFEAPEAVGSYPPADGRDWKYWTSGSPSASVKDWPIRALPTTAPPDSTREPSARSRRPGSCATASTTSG